LASAAANEASGFAPVYELLESHCGACQVQGEISFHIGHSLPQRLPDADCERFLRWIEAGAAR